MYKEDFENIQVKQRPFPFIEGIFISFARFNRGTQRQFSENICSDLEFSEHLL